MQEEEWGWCRNCNWEFDINHVDVKVIRELKQNVCVIEDSAHRIHTLFFGKKAAREQGLQRESVNRTT
jgi:hypothetical protein